MHESEELILKMNFPAVLHIQYSRAVCLSTALALVYETPHYSGVALRIREILQGGWRLVASCRGTTDYESSHAFSRSSANPATFLTRGPT